MRKNRFDMSKNPWVRGAMGASVLVLATLGPVSCMNNESPGDTAPQSTPAPETASRQASFMHFYQKLQPGIIGFDMEGTYSGTQVPEVDVRLCSYTTQDLLSDSFNSKDCEEVSGAEASMLVWGGDGKFHGPVYVQADRKIANVMVVVTPSDGLLTAQTS